MLGNLRRLRGVGRRAQYKATPAAMLAPQPLQKLIVYRQERHLKKSTACDLSLEVRLAAQQPEQRQDRVEEIGLHAAKVSLHEKVTPDQRAIQIDA
jgi:hypothetical protein